jgi:hypothetical protein
VTINRAYVEPELDLIGQNLHKKNGREFALFWTKVNQQYTAMTLLQNDLYLKTGLEFFAQFPGNITSINISNNKFYKKSTSQMVEFFSASPPSLTAITITLDDIKDRTEEELIVIGQAMRFVMELSVVSEGGLAEEHPSIDLLKKYIGFSWIRDEYQELSKINQRKDTNVLILSYTTPASEKEINGFLQRHLFFSPPSLSQEEYLESTCSEGLSR